MNVNPPLHASGHDFGDDKSYDAGASSSLPSSTPPRSDNGHAFSAEKTIGRVAEGAHHTIDRVADQAKEAGQALQEQAVHLRDVGAELTQNLRGRVRDNPITSLAVAACVGMIVGKLRR